MVHNERVFISIWLKYYSRFFAPEDIYVLDHDTTDGSTDAKGFNRLQVHRDNFDSVWQRDVVQSMQHYLMRDYDLTLFCDVDEIVMSDPRVGNLGKYMDAFKGDYATCQGCELIH